MRHSLRMDPNRRTPQGFPQGALRPRAQQCNPAPRCRNRLGGQSQYEPKPKRPDLSTVVDMPGTLAHRLHEQRGVSALRLSADETLLNYWVK